MNWDVVWSSFATLCSFENLFVLFAGMIVGIIIGALPGLTATMGVALALPLTFTMEPVTAIVLLIAIYCGGIYGGSITAILMKTPGTPAAAATAIDGYELAKKGQAKKALDMALWASVFGGIASFFALFFIAPQLAKFALKFGPPEFACLALFGLTIIISMASGSLVKGLIAGCIGVAMGFIGIDKVENCMRFTFGSTDLINGLRLVPCMIGLFAMSQVYTQYEEMFANKGKEKLKIESGSSLTFGEFFRETGNLIRGSIIGILVGAMPGTGSAIASFLNYNEAKRFSKDKENIGKGSLSGVCASEVANNAVTGAAFIPLLTLGIPGDVTTAVILGALMMQGLIPGTTLFTEHVDFVYPTMLTFLLANIAMGICGMLLIRFFAKIVEVPGKCITPIVAALCVIGSYAINNSFFDVIVMLVCSIVGYALPKFGFPTVPILIGFILGPVFETNFRNALIMSKGSYAIFFTRPICIFFLAIAAICLISALYKNYQDSKKMRESEVIE